MADFINAKTTGLTYVLKLIFLVVIESNALPGIGLHKSRTYLHINNTNRNLSKSFIPNNSASELAVFKLMKFVIKKEEPTPYKLE